MKSDRKTVSLEQALREAYKAGAGHEPAGAQLQLLQGVAQIEQALRDMGAPELADDLLRPVAPRGAMH